MTTPAAPRPGARIVTIPMPTAPLRMAAGIWVLARPNGPRNERGEGAPGVGSASSSAQPIVHAPILVVDDDPAILATVSRILESEGYTFTTAIDGAAALTAVESERPRLILLDMRMPVMDGWTFARELRARGYDIPIMVMTAASDARRWASEVDAATYVAKPFDLDELLEKIEQTLSPPQ